MDAGDRVQVLAGRRAAADYVSLLKPRILILLVIIAVASMPTGAHRLPSLLPVLAVVIGGTLAARSSLIAAST